MNSETRYRRLVIAAALALGSLGGCIPYHTPQHRYFEGALQPPGHPTSEGKFALGGSYGVRPPGGAEGIFGFPLSPSGAALVLLLDLHKLGEGWKGMDTEAVRAVYCVMPGRRNQDTWDRFMAATPTERSQFEGIHRLQGTFDVERWESNVDFRIVFDMASEPSDSERIAVRGVLTAYEEFKLGPVKP